MLLLSFARRSPLAIQRQGFAAPPRLTAAQSSRPYASFFPFFLTRPRKIGATKLHRIRARKSPGLRLPPSRYGRHVIHFQHVYCDASRDTWELVHPRRIPHSCLVFFLVTDLSVSSNGSPGSRALVLPASPFSARSPTPPIKTYLRENPTSGMPTLHPQKASWCVSLSFLHCFPTIRICILSRPERMHCDTVSCYLMHVERRPPLPHALRASCRNTLAPPTSCVSGVIGRRTPHGEHIPLDRGVDDTPNGHASSRSSAARCGSGRVWRATRGW
ncbi:hypothetical protein C8R44DRAFT_894361 [Mycena epipterygia]|nr:hypothetical protein C8R44DRAFT_894361 [Mycena epipterygia]